MSVLFTKKILTAVINYKIGGDACLVSKCILLYLPLKFYEHSNFDHPKNLAETKYCVPKYEKASLVFHSTK